jgi:hypothetical protein
VGRWEWAGQEGQRSEEACCLLLGWRQVESFRDFLKRCPHECKVVIAGNHDITMHEEYYETVGKAPHAHVFQGT